MISNANGITQSNAAIFTAYITYYILSYGIYVYYIVPVWGYMGFTFEPGMSRFIISFLTFIVFVYITPNNNDARSIFLNIFVSVYISPSLVIHAAGVSSTEAFALTCAAYLILYALSAINLPAIRLFNVSPSVFMWLLSILSILLILSFYLLGGFRFFNLDILLVYDFRAEAEEALPGIFGYLAPIFSKIVVPFGVVTGLIYRKYIFVIFFVFCAVLLFGLTSHKGMVLYPFIAAFIYYAIRISNGYVSVLILLIMAMIICFVDAYFLSYVGDNTSGWFASLFARRAIFVPALLDSHYMDFFLVNEPMYWADSRLTFGLISNMYGAPAPYVIGLTYFGDPEMGANTGFIGSGFAQARHLGVIVYAMGAGLTLALIDAHGRYQGVSFIVAIMTSQVLTMFTSTDFVTLFLTHGMLLSFMLLGIVGRPYGDAGVLVESVARRKARAS